MLTEFLYETFHRFTGSFTALSEESSSGPSCVRSIDQVVEFVVDQASSSLRAIPHVVRRLRGPVANTLHYIDEVAEQVPGVVRCERSAFTTDPRVNAFFVDHKHLQQVFSQSTEVRALFDQHPDTQECFGLLCMHREERRQLGMELVDDLVRKDVMQTTVSFTDHQIVSPGSGAADARCALKCCMFKYLISHIKKRSIQAQTERQELENRQRALSARLQRIERHPADGGDPSDLRCQLQAIEDQLQVQGPGPTSLEDRLQFVIERLSHPEQLLMGQKQSLYLDRRGVKHETLAAGAAYELPFSEIRITGQRPRVASLVSFPRDELLPERDFLKEASVFLAA